MYILTNNKLHKEPLCPICDKYVIKAEAKLIETTSYDDKFRTYDVKARFYYHENAENSTLPCTSIKSET